MPRSFENAAAGASGDVLARFAPSIFLVLWASGFGFAKLGLAHAQPLTFLALRFGIIFVLFLPIFAVLRPPAPVRRIDWLHLCVGGFLLQTVYFGLAYAGMNHGVSAGVAALIVSMQPLVVAAAAPLTTGERVGKAKWAGLLVGATGCAVVIVGRASLDASIDLGLALCVASALGMAAATLYQKCFAVTAHPVTVNLVHYGVGLFTVGPLALLVESNHVTWTGEFAFALGWLVFANSLLAVSLLLFMIRRSEASRVSALFFLVPPVAAAFGWLVLGERLGVTGLAGMAVAVAGVAIVARAR
ncbi:DMT family transporter [Pararhizobium mangrovi]|uniref:DMT family transporter n=1 Tax=Pararhizobium mangrovi TaxID=2590452 RepID=A0A506TYV1_9HYPH|nr:DMT family transporter [Pararhizobium mangrovi]TPW26670.1 DMT family transporter [Pararhizobium mangrovi]